MKKVLFVMHALHFGGAERSLVNLLCELPEECYEVDILLLRREGGFLAQLPQWVHVLQTPKKLAGLYSPIFRSGRYALAKLTGTFCAKALRQGKKPQAAWRWKHVYNRIAEKLPGHYDTAVAFSGSEILYYVADKVSADRKIVFIHNDYRTAGYSAEDDRPYMEKMDVIASISEQCVSVLRETFPQTASKLVCVENITSSEYVRKRAEEFYPPEYSENQAVNILSVGRLHPQKGFDIAIDAAAILQDRGVRFSWVILGEGQLRDALQGQIDSLGLQACVRLIGVRSNPYPYIGKCDVLVQPSRYGGKSVVLDEAKILCRPIVAAAYPTVADQIKDDEEGIVAPMSAQGIADAIELLIEDEEKRMQLVSYLSKREYGNRDEVKKYRKLLDDEA